MARKHQGQGLVLVLLPDGNHEAPPRPTPIRTVLPRHEQGGGFMAHGYARATGKPGVCMATSGPGGAVLGLAAAQVLAFAVHQGVILVRGWGDRIV